MAEHYISFETSYPQRRVTGKHPYTLGHEVKVHFASVHKVLVEGHHS